MRLPAWLKRASGWGAVWLALALPRVAAQEVGLAVSASPNPVLVGATLTYTISVTNFNLPAFALNGVWITNRLPASVQHLAATNDYGSVTVQGQNVIFELASFEVGTYARMTVAGAPTVVGTVTNLVSAAAVGVLANVYSTQAVTQVISGQADLGVALQGLPTAALAGDWLTYTLAVSNAGPDRVANARLKHELPAGVGLLAVTPSTQAYTRTNNALEFALDALVAGGTAAIALTVEPTNAGSLTFAASVGAGGLWDTNTANDAATTSAGIGAFLAGALTAVPVTEATYDPQTGLLTQTVRLSNTGAGAAASARVLVSGLETNRLFNAVGTNDGRPWIGYGASLASGGTVDLVLEYFAASRLPVSNLVFAAVETPAFETSVPQGTALEIARALRLPGGVLVEFPATLGARYAMQYSDDASFSAARTAQPPIAASGTRVQWIDSGPPKTISAPSNTTTRFYRVVQLP